MWFFKKKTIRDIGVNHTDCIDENGNKVEKPWAHKSMMVSFLRDNKFETIVVPISTFELVHDDSVVPICKITFARPNTFRNTLPQRTEKIIFSITDDPMKEWAGDWTNLGAFGIVFSMEHCVMTDNPLLEYVCLEIHAPQEYGKLLTPDREEKVTQ